MTMIVLTVTAILVVGFVLCWDILSEKLTELLNTELYSSEEPLTRSDTVVTLSFPEAVGLPEDERAVLEKYFTCYFASLGSFYSENISRFFSPMCEDELLDLMALESEISSAKSAAANCSFKECAVRFTVLSRRSLGKEKPDTAELVVECSTEIKYAFSSLPARTSGEKHIFLLTRDGKECLISGHTTDRPARAYAETMLDEVLEEAGYTREDLSYTYYAPYIARTKELLSEQLDAFHENVSLSFGQAYEQMPEAEYEYDRESAAEYARGTAHSEKYGSYEENDANFASQCLSAGGIPMDAQGDRFTQWKWYGYEENNARERSGCTKSWFDRGRFWSYALENTGFGLAAKPAAYGQAGDIIQLMGKEEPFLQAVITGTISGSDGEPADYLICTDKIKNIPLSLVWAGDFRIMHIVGYNTANI